MKTADKIVTTIIILALICLFYLIKPVLAPFICSLVASYFLNPLVTFFNRKYKLSRLAATNLILGLFLTSFTALCIILAPIIYSQLVALLDALPSYLQTVGDNFQTIGNKFYPKIAAIFNKVGLKFEGDFSNILANEQIPAKFVNLSRKIVYNALTSSMALINILSLIFITPVLIFYLLKDWNILLQKIDDYLPRNIALSVKEIAAEIDITLSCYVRGQFNVCFILGIFYAILLSLVRLDFGFLIGFLTGILSFIPYVGMLCGALTAIIVALFQGGFNISYITLILLIFICGQLVEANFLTPKLIGAKIGLHPFWLIFGLFVFSALFGFIGILSAVPLTAICGIIIKHFALKYKKG
jgi:predicted PurR-regulated permease PerM